MIKSKATVVSSKKKSTKPKSTNKAKSKNLKPLISSLNNTKKEETGTILVKHQAPIQHNHESFVVEANKLANFLSGSVYDNMNANTRMTRNIVTRVTAHISDLVEHNVEIGQDFLQCKNIIDALEMQRKMINTRFSDSFRLYFDIAKQIQNR